MFKKEMLPEVKCTKLSHVKRRNIPSAEKYALAGNLRMVLPEGVEYWHFSGRANEVFENHLVSLSPAAQTMIF